MDVARRVTVEVAGMAIGAVYTPAAEIVPDVAEPPATPLTDHVTAVLALPVTVAVNAWELPSETETEVGLTATLAVGAATSVTVACAYARALTADVARIVTVGEAGSVAGAV